MSPPIIRTRGLTKRFGDFTAVSDLSIEVMPGTIFAFLGANGSGKSTTIRMLIGLLRPSAGTVEVDGIDVIRRPRRVRDHIGYMGQKVSLYQGLTLRENVEFYAGLYGLAGAALAQRWGALCQRYSDGYRIEVGLPPAARDSAARALGGIAGEVAATSGGLAIRVPALDPPVLAALDRLVAAGARLDIQQPQMNDVFRRLLAASGTAA